MASLSAVHQIISMPLTYLSQFTCCCMSAAFWSGASLVSLWNLSLHLFMSERGCNTWKSRGPTLHFFITMKEKVRSHTTTNVFFLTHNIKSKPRLTTPMYFLKDSFILFDLLLSPSLWMLCGCDFFHVGTENNIAIFILLKSIIRTWYMLT